MTQLTLKDATNIYMERMGGPLEERFAINFHGKRGSNILVAADAQMRLWAMRAAPRAVEEVRYQVEFARGHRIQGVLEMTRETAHACAVVQTHIAKRIEALLDDGEQAGESGIAVGGAA